MSLSARRRNERGVAYPSPVVMLSIIAVAMAGIAFVATKDAPEQERRVAPVSQESVAPSATPTPTAPAKTKKPKPKINRGKVYVEVFNNSGITGLAGKTAGKITAAGWQVVGSDNWVGHIPADTVYYPPKLKAEGKQLALDLGIKRTKESIAPMKFDRLTVILTG